MEKRGEQDWRAAMSEIRSNVEVRRLMFVFMHVLLPGAVLAAADVLSGSEYPESLAWLPRHVLPFSGALLAATGSVVCVVLARCHFGLVVNSMKMQCVEAGGFTPRGLNWLGVTTNFVALSALAAGSSAALLLVSLGWTLTGCAAGAILCLMLMRRLVVNHTRANDLAARLRPNWEKAEVPLELRERHIVHSLEDCNADVAVVVTMAAALFTGFFAAMANVGSIPGTLAAGIATDPLKRWCVPALSGYLTVSILLSVRMVLRLRGGIADHSLALARLRAEPDDPWRFNPIERTFLLFLLVLMLLGASAVILVWSVGGRAPALVAGGAVVLLGVLRYRQFLGNGRRKAWSAAASPTPPAPATPGSPHPGAYPTGAPPA